VFTNLLKEESYAHFEARSVLLGKKLFDFGFGIAKNKQILPLIKIECKMCLSNDIKTPGYCLQNVLDNKHRKTMQKHGTSIAYKIKKIFKIDICFNCMIFIRFD
jgi:hypothetical protein